MINLQNCKSQTPVESYITSSVVRGAPVTPTPAVTAASRRAGRPWSCTGDTHISAQGQGSWPQPGCSGGPNTPGTAKPQRQPHPADSPQHRQQRFLYSHFHPAAAPSSPFTLQLYNQNPTCQPSQLRFQSDSCSFAQKHYLKLLHVLLKFWKNS